MKKILVAIATIAGLGLMVTPAQAEEEPTVVTVQIKDTPDNECPAWARDTFTRTITLTPLPEDADSSYQVRFDSEGTWETPDGLSGTLTGFIEYQISGELDETKVIDETVDFGAYECKDDVPEKDGAGNFALRYFEQGAEATGISDWRYTYATECKTFVEQPGSESVGKETFAPCPVETTPLKPALTQPTCETPEPELTIPEVEGVTYAVDGSVTPGHTVTVTATADEGYVLTEGEWTWDFSITAVPGCDGEDGRDGEDGEDGKDGEDAPTPTPTPSPDPDPSSSPTPGDTLPDTGAPVLPMTLAGAGLAGAGALLRKVFG